MPSLVDVYPYRLNESPEFLILKRAHGKQYAGQWRMIGGKIESCEAAWQSGLRELREETGLFPETFWTVPSVNQFYEAATDTLHHIPVFAAKVAADAIINLDEEHLEFKWIQSAELNTFIHWPEQQRLITLIHQILKSQKVLDEWKIPL